MALNLMEIKSNEPTVEEKYACLQEEYARLQEKLSATKKKLMKKILKLQCGKRRSYEFLPVFLLWNYSTLFGRG